MAYITEIPLKAEPWHADTIDTRFEAARQLYNAALGELLDRVDLMHESKAWQYAESNEERSEIQKDFDLDLTARQFSNSFRKSNFTGTWLHDHMQTGVANKVIERAYEAVMNWMYGRKGRPNFKVKGDMRSVESASTSLEWGGTYLEWRTGRGGTGTLKVPVDQSKIDERAEHGIANFEARLEDGTPMIRLVRDRIFGQRRYFAQLSCEGHPPLSDRIHPEEGEVGLYLGVSVLALYAGDRAWVQSIVPDLPDYAEELTRLDRQLDRQRRKNNPEFFADNGQYIQGVDSEWTVSNRQQKVRDKRDDLRRKLAEYRKRAHGRLTNDLLEFGNTFYVIERPRDTWKEAKGWLADPIQHRAPSELIRRLRYKAEAAGGEVIDVPPESGVFTTCHNCGSVQDGWGPWDQHVCSCGIQVPKPVYSAYLAGHYDPDEEKLDVDQIRENWSGVHQLLVAASKSRPEVAFRRDLKGSASSPRGKSGSS